MHIGGWLKKVKGALIIWNPNTESELRLSIMLAWRTSMAVGRAGQLHKAKKMDKKECHLSLIL